MEAAPYRGTADAGYRSRGRIGGHPARLGDTAETARLDGPVLLPHIRSGGSPRAIRAWPLAWPSPSGPLGRQRLRRSRVGPEDPFCEAVRKDLRVPLTLEGPTWTMRGVPSGACDTLFRRSAHSARCHRPGRGAGGRGSGIRRGPQRPVTWGAVRGSRRAWWASAQRARRKAAAPQRRDPRLNPGRLRRVTLAAHPPQLLAPILAIRRLGPSGPARRRCALEAVEKVVTALPRRT
jgi:hypothetical protein